MVPPLLVSEQDFGTRLLGLSTNHACNKCAVHFASQTSSTWCGMARARRLRSPFDGGLQGPPIDALVFAVEVILVLELVMVEVHLGQLQITLHLSLTSHIVPSISATS